MIAIVQLIMTDIAVSGVVDSQFTLFNQNHIICLNILALYSDLL